jgi:hypothetical protein
MNARAIATLALLAAAAAGCVPNDATVRIYGLCFPPTPTDVGACTYASTCDSLILGGLEFDTASAAPDGPLIWPVQIDNQRAANADRAGGIDTAIAWVEGYKISYDSAAGIPDVDIGISRSPINQGSSSVVIAPVIPRSVGTFLSSSPAGEMPIVAHLKAYGRYGDGSTFETGPFKIVVTATTCLGGICASSVPVCSDPTKPVVLGSCPQPFQTSVTACTAAAAP